MRRFWSYLRYSQVQLVLNLNPITWWVPPVFFERIDHSYFDPCAHGFHLRVLMLRLSVMIDDGSF
jgi:hypothetical protein